MCIIDPLMKFFAYITVIMTNRGTPTNCYEFALLSNARPATPIPLVSQRRSQCSVMGFTLRDIVQWLREPVTEAAAWALLEESARTLAQKIQGEPLVDSCVRHTRSSRSLFTYCIARSRCKQRTAHLTWLRLADKRGSTTVCIRPSRYIHTFIFIIRFGDAVPNILQKENEVTSKAVFIANVIFAYQKNWR